MKSDTPTAISPGNPMVLKKALFIFIPFYLVLISISTYIYRIQTTSNLLLKKGYEVHAISNGKSYVCSELLPIFQDIEFMAGLAGNFVSDAKDGEKAAVLPEMISQMDIFARTHKKYDQIRFLDHAGWERIRINKTAAGTEIVPPERLQFKGHRYYFKKTMGLKKEQIYLSPLDLNIENGKIEIPYKPMIRVAKPIYDRFGNARGMVVLNYLGEYLIKKLEKTSQEKHTELMLLDKDGFWLRGMEKEDGETEEIKTRQSFSNRFPNAWSGIEDTHTGQVETDAGLFTFSTISPLSEAVEFLNPEASTRTHPINPTGEHWKIVSFIPRKILYAHQQAWKIGNIVFCLISLFIIGWGAWRLSWLSVLKKSNEDRLLHAKQGLEYRIHQRTRDLEDTNSRLMEEIESRKQAQNDLQFSERKYRTLIETMREGLLILDRQGTVTYANNQLLQMLAYRSENVVGKTYDVFFDQKNLEIFNKERENRKTGVADPYEIDWTASDSRQIQTLVSPAIIRDEQGRFNGSFGIVSDISQRKKDEKAIRLNRRRLKALLDLSRMEEKSEYELASFALEQGVRLTQSQGGYFHFYDEDSGRITLTSWSEAVRQSCDSSKDTHYPLESAGIWADSIRLRKPVFHNDYQAISEKQGYPEGHFHVRRHMSIPVYEGNRIIAIAGVGNKADPYDDTDAEQLVLLMTDTWRIITKKRMEQDLLASEDRYRTLFETMGQGVIYQDAEGRVISANQAAENILGVSLDTLLNQVPENPGWNLVRENGIRFDPEDYPPMRALRTGRPVNNVIMGVSHPKRKHLTWIKVDALPLFRENGNRPSSVYTIIDDITENKMAQEAIEASETKHRNMMEAMDDPAYICSPDYVISYMNPAMAKWLGGDFVGRACYAAIYQKESKCPWCTFEKTRKLEHQRYTVLNPKDGRHYNVSNSPITNPDGSVSKFTIFRDITETLNLEKQLRQVQKLEAIGTLAGGIAHDFNNILFAIMGYAEIALLSVGKQDQIYQDLREIINAGMRAKELVQQILTFSRQTEQEMQPIRIGLIIKETLKLLKASLPSTIEIREKISSSSRIMADATQIHQVVMNLCTNGAHAMEKDGGILSVELEDIEVDQNLASKFINMPKGDYLHLRIADTGLGIRKEDLERIFEPFYTTKPEGKGTGLGLSLVHGIVKNHKGQISVESIPGEGASFDVYLPSLSADPEEFELKSHVEEILTGNEKILLVDDEKMIIEVNKRNLEKYGYSVDGVIDPEKAVEMFEQAPFDYDMVITDMTMPKMTGDILAEKLLSIRPELPIILLTGFSNKIDPKASPPNGIKGVLMKPVIRSDLLGMVRNLFDSLSI